MRFTRLPLCIALVAAGSVLCTPLPSAAQTTLNVVTAGDQNMVDYVNDFLGPRFEKLNPGVKVRAVGTGPGDAGSQKIYEKLSAQQKSGALAKAFEMGDPSADLAKVMVASQQSQIAFRATVEVRNRLVQAYQDVMNMPL